MTLPFYPPPLPRSPSCGNQPHRRNPASRQEGDILIVPSWEVFFFWRKIEYFRLVFFFKLELPLHGLCERPHVRSLGRLRRRGEWRSGTALSCVHQLYGAKLHTAAHSECLVIQIMYCVVTHLFIASANAQPNVCLHHKGKDKISWILLLNMGKE